MKKNSQIDVKAFRDKHGLTQTQLAKLLKINQAQISRYEAGAKVPGPIQYILEQVEARNIPIEAPA